MREGTREQYEDRILRVQMYIQKHLDEPLPLDELAGVACFSPYHFHRIFGAMVGESVMEYIRRLRLERAAYDLIYTDDQVAAVALNAGYETHEAFTRAFRGMFGESPRHYRDNFRHGSMPKGKPRAQRFVAVITRFEGVDMEAHVKKFESMTVAFVRHTGPYQDCEPAWMKLCSDPGVQRQMGPDTLSIGICYDDPDVTEPDKIRMDACVTVTGEFTPGPGINRQVIGGGDYAVLTHRGPMEGLHDCYRWLFGEWLPGSGREPDKSYSLEIYRKYDPKIPPSEWVTDICIPLK